MKVLMLNGSCNERGCTYTALEEIGRTLREEGVDCEIFQLGADPVRDCIGCGGCAGGSCVFTDDGVNRFVEKARKADGFVFGTPVYYAPAAAVASARRAGTTASIDALGKYFGISRMLTVGSTYWSMVHGNCPADVLQDREGLQTMRNLAREMAWLMRCIETARAAGICPPAPERTERTNFIR